MRNPFKSNPSPDASQVSPEESIRIAQAGLAQTKTMTDAFGRHVKVPDEARAQMEATLAKVAEVQARGSAQPPPVDPELEQLTQLEQLEGLHDRGVLSDEEYAAEQARILGGS